MPKFLGINGALLPYNELQKILQVSPFQYQTVQAAIDAADPGQVIELTPGAYLESVTIDKAIALVCKAAPGSCAIMGIHVLADDVSLWNVGAFAESDTDPYALKVGSQTVSPDRFRSFGGKFENAVACILLQGAGDVQLNGVECCWGGSGIVFAANDDGYCTQVSIIEPRFHNLTTVHVGNAENGGVVNLDLAYGTSDNAEDGTAPTDYIKVDRSGDTGIIRHCDFATATNDASVLTIASGIKWVANSTVAGISTAAPS